jgi:hypothetical protein
MLAKVKEMGKAKCGGQFSYEIGEVGGRRG